MMQTKESITYLGHATLLIEMNGTRLLTDPILRRRVAHLHRKVPLIPVEKDVDAVLISHLHWDHFDMPSLRRLGVDTYLIVPRGSAGLVRQWGFKHVEEIVPGETIIVGEIEVEATPADHSGKRFPFGPTVLPMGYMMRGSYKIYFAGDTEEFPGMRAYAPELDVALLPVWGWGPNLGDGHMDPRDAVEALGFLNPRLAIPIHWGTFFPIGLGWLKPTILHMPPRMFARDAAEMTPQVEVRILEPGEYFDLGQLPNTND
jgi:L-ascorbate metabolism protein UlaG (beta-lactamase superfamily)